MAEPDDALTYTPAGYGTSVRVPGPRVLPAWYGRELDRPVWHWKRWIKTHHAAREDDLTLLLKALRRVNGDG